MYIVINYVRVKAIRVLIVFSTVVIIAISTLVSVIHVQNKVVICVSYTVD